MKVSELPVTVQCDVTPVVFSDVTPALSCSSFELGQLHIEEDRSHAQCIIDSPAMTGERSLKHSCSRLVRPEHIRNRTGSTLFSSQDSERLYIRIYDQVISPHCSSTALTHLREHFSCSSASKSAGVSSSNFISNDSASDSNEGVVNGDVNRLIKIRVAELVLSELEYFEHLLTALCTKRRRLASRKMELALLEILLTTDRLLARANITNRKLTFGDTPIIQAARARDDDVIRLLVRYGADVNESWMRFRNAVEVLLFSPTQRYVSSTDVQAIEQCLPLLLSVIQNGNVVLGLEELERNSYFSLHPNWKEALRVAMHVAWDCNSVVPSLKHLCRFRIRASVRPSNTVFYGLTSLPLPSILKRYLTFEDMS